MVGLSLRRKIGGQRMRWRGLCERTSEGGHAPGCCTGIASKRAESIARAHYRREKRQPMSRASLVWRKRERWGDERRKKGRDDGNHSPSRPNRLAQKNLRAQNKYKLDNADLALDRLANLFHTAILAIAPEFTLSRSLRLTLDRLKKLIKCACDEVDRCRSRFESLAQPRPWIRPLTRPGPR